MDRKKNGDNDPAGGGKDEKKVAPKGRKSTRHRGELEGQIVRVGAAEGLIASGDRVYDCPSDCTRLTVIVKQPKAGIDRLTVTL
jgi:hypothetical protein